MELFLLVILLSCATGIAIAVLLGSRNEKEINARWAEILDPDILSRYQRAGEHFQTRNQLLEASLAEARRMLELGDYDEVARLIGRGCDLMQGSADNISEVLATISLHANMVSTLISPPPPASASFRLPHLVRLAYLHNALHKLLLSSELRFRLRLYVESKGVKLVVDLLRRNAKAVEDRPHEVRDRWDKIEGCYADFRTLSDQSLESVRAFMKSLEIEMEKRKDRDKRKGKDKSSKPDLML